MHQNPCVMSKSNTLRKNSVLTKISKKRKEFTFRGKGKKNE